MNTYKIYAKTIDETAIKQIKEMANSPIGENGHIRIMPDAHAGKGCVIGTTMKVTDKVCPNIVGVDIGCGVNLVKTDINFEDNLEKLDNIIRNEIPFGKEVHTSERDFNFANLRCWSKLSPEIQERAKHSLGTLGGGNHFIEAYNNGYLAVHSGSRGIGKAVADFYQNLAEKAEFNRNRNKYYEELQKVPPTERSEWVKIHQIEKASPLAYLEGKDMEDYLHDCKIMQDFANKNRSTMLSEIIISMDGFKVIEIESIHNYIDIDSRILRKGAISAKKGEILVIPLNMRDGILICEGKGNNEWNCSAPHGAGRLYSRGAARKAFSVEEYAESMKGVFTTCVNEDTLDEAPFVYKDYNEIIDCIEPTVEIKERLIPIYNFKASE